MKLEQAFEVDAPLEAVWETLIDVERVAPCLPGAAVTGRNDDGSFNGTFSVRIGPASASYAGKLYMGDIDERAHTATMRAAGTDKRGQGGARATIVSKLTPLGGSTQVEVVTDYAITGRLASFGRSGMIEDISERLLREFARCLQVSLAGNGGDRATAGDRGESAAAGESASGQEATPPAGAPAADWAPTTPAPAAAEPIEGISLVSSVLWARMRRHPEQVLAAALGFLLILAARRKTLRRRV
jgi:carbon monoxide dehydrogenase subunit G